MSGRARRLAIWPGGPPPPDVGDLLQLVCGFYGRKAALRRANRTQSASVVMSTLSRSDTGPSSSTFHREESAVVKDEYSESGVPSEYKTKRSST
eukprot:2987717-Pleurochrysis_carterae.AAC.1